MIDSLIAFSIWLSEINSEKILLSLQQRCNILWLIGLLRLFSIFLELNSGPISRLEILRDFCHFSTWTNRPHAVIVLTMSHMCESKFSIIGELAHSRFLIKNPLSDSFPPESPPLNCIMLFEIGDISDLKPQSFTTWHP